MDRCARPCDPAAALRRGAARCRGDVADRRHPADRRDAAGHRASARRPGSCRSWRRCGRRSRIMCGNVLIRSEEQVPLFVGARGGPLNPDLVRRSVAAARRRLGLPDTLTPHALEAQFRDASASAAVRTCERFRNCSAMRACRRPRFTRRWTRRDFSTSIATPTPAPEQRPRWPQCSKAALER